MRPARPGRLESTHAMQARIAKETLYAHAIKRHSYEALVQLRAACETQGPRLLKKGYAQDSHGAACLSTDPQAVRWSAYGLYECVLRERFPTTPLYRFHMHNAVGSVMSHAIGLSAEALLRYNPNATGRRRANRGMDWLIYEAPQSDDLVQVIDTAAEFVKLIPPERVMEPLTGKPGADLTPKDYPEGAQLVDVDPETA
jgi:hypothetical protein